MRVRANVEGLKAAVAAVSSVVPTKSPNPILTSILLEAKEGETTVTGNDLEVALVYTVAGVEVQEPGAVVMPPKKLLEFLNLTTDPDVTIETADTHVVIRSSRGCSRLPSEDDGLFPRAAAFDAKNYQICDGQHLRIAIDRTVFAADPTSTRYALAGVQFEVDGESVKLVATDGRRLALQPIDGVKSHGEIEPSKQVVPIKGLKAALKILDNSGCHFYFTKNSFHLRTERATLYARLVEGRFPPWGDVVPLQKDRTFEAIAKSSELLQSVKQAGITTSEESRGVEFKFHPSGKCELISKSEGGNSSVEMSYEHVSGNPIEIAFAQHYLVSGIAQMDENSDVRIHLQNEKGAALFEGDNEYQYVVMPLTKEA